MEKVFLNGENRYILKNEYFETRGELFYFMKKNVINEIYFKLKNINKEKFFRNTVGTYHDFEDLDYLSTEIEGNSFSFFGYSKNFRSVHSFLLNLNYFYCNCRSFYQVSEFMKIMKEFGYGLSYLNDKPIKNYNFFNNKSYSKYLEKSKKETGILSFGFNYGMCKYNVVRTEDDFCGIEFEQWKEIYYKNY